MHTATILQLLDSQKCYACGGRSVAGAKICVSCASELTVADLAMIRDKASGGGAPETGTGSTGSPAGGG